MLPLLTWLLHGEDVAARIGWALTGGLSAMAAAAADKWPLTPVQWILVAVAAVAGWSGKRRPDAAIQAGQEEVDP